MGVVMERSTRASFVTAFLTSPLALARRAFFSTLLWRASQDSGRQTHDVAFMYWIKMQVLQCRVHVQEACLQVASKRRG